MLFKDTENNEIYTLSYTLYLHDALPIYDMVIEKPKYLGITELADSSINMRIIAKTVESQHFQIERDIRNDLVIFCVDNNIEIPFPQLVVHNE